MAHITDLKVDFSEVSSSYNSASFDDVHIIDFKHFWKKLCTAISPKPFDISKWFSTGFILLSILHVLMHILLVLKYIKHFDK